jgi:uncharacterized integral membrane protein (TIGR00697 family)
MSKMKPIKDHIYNYKFLLYFAMLYITLDLASNVVAYREVSLGFALFPGATFIYPLTYTLADIITEIYGYATMRKVIWAGIICDFVFSLAVLAVLKLPYPNNWELEPAYVTVLSNLLRLNVGCAVALLVGAFANAYLISRWKIYVRGRIFWLRSLVSSALGEAVYLLIAGVITFYGVVPTDELVKLLSFNYMFKLAYNCVAVIPASIIVVLLKKYEAATEQTSFSFNPFKL